MSVLDYDVTIIGAGMAGLTAAIYARRAGKSEAENIEKDGGSGRHSGCKCTMMGISIICGKVYNRV